MLKTLDEILKLLRQLWERLTCGPDTGEPTQLDRMEKKLGEIHAGMFGEPDETAALRLAALADKAEGMVDATVALKDKAKEIGNAE